MSLLQALAELPPPTESAVRYGDHPRNQLDFYRAQSLGPTPVLIYFHGGGWKANDRTQIRQRKIAQEALDNGVSLISADYCFITGPDARVYPGPMLDAARVVQFVRSRAADWNLDPGRIAICGNSAGGAMALWVALRDDMADPASDDIVERQSTRVRCVLATNTPTTLDPNIIRQRVGGTPDIHRGLLALFGAKSISDLDGPGFAAKIREASAVSHVSEDDPPIHLFFPKSNPASAPLPESASFSAVIHHAMFGKILEEKCDEAGVVCILNHEGMQASCSQLEFLKEHLTGRPANTGDPAGALQRGNR